MTPGFSKQAFVLAISMLLCSRVHAEFPFVESCCTNNDHVCVPQGFDVSFPQVSRTPGQIFVWADSTSIDGGSAIHDQASIRPRAAATHWPEGWFDRVDGMKAPRFVMPALSGSCRPRITLVAASNIRFAPLEPAGYSISDSGERLEVPSLVGGWSVPPADDEVTDDGACVSLQPADVRLSFLCDIKTAPSWIGHDLRTLATWENAAFLGVTAGGALLLRGTVDHEVQDNIQQHGSYWGGTSRVLNRAGEAVVHIPLLVGLYTYSLHTQNEDLHELTLALVTSYKFSALSTLGLQYATQTRHGDNGGFSILKDHGFPSMPASSSFAMAAVVDERYGWKVGIPAYVGAGLIGWAGIDQQQHRVSDVAFGAALGYAIGKSIGAMHYRPDATFKLLPFSDSLTGAQGMQVEQQF